MRSVISPRQDGGGGGWFCLADKYSNQMSVPLWDPEAQIQAIPGSSLIQKNHCVGCMRVYLNTNVLKKEKTAKQIICQMPTNIGNGLLYLIMGLFLKSP